MMNAYRRSALGCVIAVLLFHIWQNFFATHGGNIALPKSWWLGLTIFCWLILPPLIIRHSIHIRAKKVWWCFWLCMIARSVMEMWLLYGVQQWKYSYGIGHDIFSAILLLFGAFWCILGNLKIKTPEITHMLIMSAMFLFETAFAYYISHFNDNHAHAKLWFIDWQRIHLPNLLLTILSEIGLIIWLIRLDKWFLRRLN